MLREFVMISILLNKICCCIPRKVPSYQDINDDGSLIKIAAFKVDLDNKKYRNKDAMNYIYKYVKIDESKIENIIEQLNSRNNSTGYKYIKNDPERRNEELYLFIYKSSVTLIDHYTYNDHYDEFKRNPFIALFTALDHNFVIIGARLYQKEAQEDLDRLVRVYETLKWKDEPVLIMGNLMTGRMSNEKLQESQLYTDERFNWLINDVDTTVSEKNDLTHDRIIADNHMLKFIIKDSARAFNFAEYFELEEHEAKDVSERYPVEITIANSKWKKGQIDTYKKHDLIDDEENINLEAALSHLKITPVDNNGVRIGAFNIERLSAKKFKRKGILKGLIYIIRRYHILFVQELQCENNIDIVHDFIKELNSETDIPYYKTVLTEKGIGRKGYKEQYMYIYRSDVFDVVGDKDKFVYDEKGTDTFMREPYIVRFKSSYTAIEEFAIIGCHVRPKNVASEMDELVNVHTEVKKKWGSEIPVVLMGDFNADGRYLTNKEEAQLKLKRDKGYRWLLENVDTTVGKNTNNYDRIILYGDVWDGNVHSAQAYRFDDEMDLSRDEAGEISDHYPVEFILRKKIEKDEL